MSRDTPSSQPPGPGDTSDDSAKSVDSWLRAAAAISEPSADEGTFVPHLRPGDVVGDRFRVERLARSGGMGAVYRAQDLACGRHVAVKVVQQPSPSVRERFEREAAVLSKLSHPCVVGYIAHGVTSRGSPFLAMDWLDGEDLARRLTHSALDLAASLVVLRRLCEGLAAAHARGIVHRDVKPSNIFLVGGEPGRTRVIDFGLARVAGTAALTRPGTSLGTAGYMAPEQMDAPDVDARADVFAVGCVLYECLTGRPAFEGRPAAVVVKVQREHPPRPSKLRPELGDAWDALVSRLMAKDRARRPKDAGEALRAIDELHH